VAFVPIDAHWDKNHQSQLMPIGTKVTSSN
jgi:hypothetical protein